MRVLKFLFRLFRQAPSKRQFLRSLALGVKTGDRTVTSADGTSLSVRRSGEGPPVVLVHGVLDNISAFSFVELQLAERYSIWVYDRRGRGGSGDAGQYSLEREIDDLRAVVAATRELPHVIAHSYGALIALHAAAAGVKIRSLVLYEPPVNGGAMPEERVAEIGRAVDEGRFDEAVEMVARGLAGVTEEELSVAMAVPPVREGMRDAVRTAPRELEVIRSVGESAPSPVGLPVLLLRGERDSSAVYARLE